MDTTGMSTAGMQGEQAETVSTPSEEDVSPVLNESSALLNFSELTPRQFGISAQSFIPSSSNRKSTSRLAQIKARRRSSIGVRGSPETNSLIRFMAQQRMKTPPAHQSSEQVRSSPFPPRVTSTLRQKMASFQSLMDVEETEVCDQMPRQDSDGGGCIKTRDYVPDGNSLNRGKENDPPIPSKRRCLGPLKGCEVEIREASAPTLHFTLKEQEEQKEQNGTEGPKPSTEIAEEFQAVLFSPVHPCGIQDSSSAKNNQDGVFELQSPRQTPCDDPAAISATQLVSPFHIFSLPSLLEMEPKAKNDPSGTSTIKKKKKVHFGGPLSPEFFDKNLPPSTPLQKGATPARAPTPGGALRPVLKTPQRNESHTSPAQPDFSSPTVFGASPVLAMPRNSRITSVAKDNEDEDGKIVFTSMEEFDSAMMSCTEEALEPQPLNLNNAFHEESLSQTVTDSETQFGTAPQMDLLDKLATFPDKEKKPEAGAEASPAPVKSPKRRKECESTSVAPARSSSRKRKQPEESEPVKRSTRSAAVSASGKMKISSTAARRWNRDVDRSLYGSRKYASKNPSLSPITERLSLVSQSTAALTTSSAVFTVTDQETCLTPEMANDTQAVDEHTMTNALNNPSDGSVTSPHFNKESTSRKGGRLSKPRVRKGRGLKKRKVSVGNSDLLDEEPLHQTGGDTEELHKEQTTTAHEASNNIPTENDVPDQGGVDMEASGQISADTPSIPSDSTLPTSCLLSGEELSHTLNLPEDPTQEKEDEGSSVNSPKLQEQRDKVEGRLVSCRAEENGSGGHPSSQAESGSCSDGQEDEGVANVHLAPWQADFNFEDVFKPVSTRGQRSVRRSLRNQRNTAPSNGSAGLAWVPRISPDSRKDPRRRTRGRRLSAALAVQPSLEQAQDNMS